MANPHLVDNNPDKIIDDSQSLAVKDKVMKRLKANSVYNSISKVAMFVGTMLTTAGVTMGLGVLAGTAAIAAPVSVIIGVLALGATFLATAVGTDYAASRIYQGANFDNLEANAESTSRHLVKELKANNMCVVEHQPEMQTQAEAPQKEWAKTIEIQRKNGELTVNQRA